MANYTWPSPTYQTKVFGNAAAGNSAVAMYQTANANIVTNRIPFFFTRNAGLGGNVSGLLTSDALIFDGANLVIANTTANTNVVITTNGDINATGNIAGLYLFGDGSNITNLAPTTTLANGTSNVAIPVSSDGVVISVAGVSNVVVFQPTTANFAGSISAVGNVSGNYILGNGALLTGVTTSSNAIFDGTSNVKVVSTSGNVATSVAGNPDIVVVAATGQYVTGIVSATGNVEANYFIGNGSQLTGLVATVSNISNGSSNVSVPVNSGNVSVAVAGTPDIAVVAPTGLYVTGETSVTGNVLASYFAGNGSLLTGITTSSNAITNGTSNVAIDTAGGNITTGVAGNPNVVVTAATGVYVTGDISASGNIYGNLNQVITANISATGNITSNSYFVGNGYYLTGITQSFSNIGNGTSNVEVAFSGNVTVGIGGTANQVVISPLGFVANGIVQATGNLIGANVITAGNVSGNYIIGDGSQLTNISNVANITVTDTTLSPSYTLGNITLQTYDTANSLSYALTFDATGNLTMPGNVTGNYIFANSGLFLNSDTVTANYFIPSGYNALSAGPITITPGANVSGDGNWVVV